MATLEIVLDFDSLKVFQQALETAPDDLTEEIEKAGEDIMEIWRGQLAEYPAGPTYPVHWDSEKQRRAFFATEGFGGGIPHVREGALPESWHKQIMRSAQQTVFEARTDMPGAKYVEDRNWQSNIHRGRWQTVQGVAADTRSRVTERLLQAVNAGFQTVAAKINAARGGD